MAEKKKRPTLRAALQEARSFITQQHHYLGRCVDKDCEFKAVIKVDLIQHRMDQFNRRSFLKLQPD